VNMPVMNGLDVVKLHRFATADGESPPFIALTADATEETRRECAEAGMVAYLTKPVDMEQLLVLIDRMAHPDPAVRSSYSSHAQPLGTDSQPGPVLDARHLDRLRQLDDHDDFLGGLIRDFITDAEQLVEELETAALHCDAAAFRDRAHALRSSAAHLGATALFELCLQWRGIGTDELAAEGSVYAMRVRSEFERLREALLVELARPEVSGATAVSRPH
jgi:two-component system, sensor histidine kinase RpfC